MSDIDQHLRVLGLEPGASLAEAEQAYKDAVQVSDPGRYSDARLRKRAEERLLEINEAFAALQTFLLARSSTGKPSVQHPDTRQASRSNEQPTLAGTGVQPPGAITDATPSTTPSVRARWPMVLWLIAAVIVVFVIVRLHTPSTTSVSEQSAPSTSPGAPSLSPAPIPQSPVLIPAPAPPTITPPSRSPGNQTPSTPLSPGLRENSPTKSPQPSSPPSIAPGPEQTGTFTLGSTKDRVKAVQGTPTGSSETRWEYDFSYVTFDSSGRVSAYNNISHNLRVRLLPSTASTATYFTIGSTKDEVLSAQGTPTGVNDSQTRWEYDFSYVTFDSSGRVLAYNDISHNLRVR